MRTVEAAASDPVADPQAEVLRLFGEQGTPLYRFCRSVLRDGDDAEDVVQDTFVKLLQHLRASGDRSNLRGWLFTVAANGCRMTGLLVVLVGALGASTMIGLWLWAPAGVLWPDGRVVLLMMIHLGALAWCFGRIALAAAATVRRRASAIGLVSLISVTLFLLDILAEFSPRFERFGWLTPFHYFHGSELLRGAADSAVDLTVFGGLGAIAAACAFWQFDRRDL